MCLLQSMSLVSNQNRSASAWSPISWNDEFPITFDVMVGLIHPNARLICSALFARGINLYIKLIEKVERKEGALTHLPCFFVLLL